jgi:hypothetical protein
MNRIRRIHRFLGVLAGLAGALLACAATGPAALAIPPPAGGTGSTAVTPRPQVVIHTVTTGGMPGWQITLIAIGAALLAAFVSVFLDRILAARRQQPTTAA